MKECCDYIAKYYVEGEYVTTELICQVLAAADPVQVATSTPVKYESEYTYLKLM